MSSFAQYAPNLFALLIASGIVFALIWRAAWYTDPAHPERRSDSSP